MLMDCQVKSVPAWLAEVYEISCVDAMCALNCFVVYSIEGRFVVLKGGPTSGSFWSRRPMSWPYR